MAVPALMYGSEGWILITDNKRKLERQKLVLGYTLLDQKKKKDIWEEVNVVNLKNKIQMPVYQHWD